MGGRGLDEADSGSGQVTGCWVHDHELSDSIICGELAFEGLCSMELVSRATAIS
jgi:hypothetical protein